MTASVSRRNLLRAGLLLPLAAAACGEEGDGPAGVAQAFTSEGVPAAYLGAPEKDARTLLTLDGWARGERVTLSPAYAVRAPLEQTSTLLKDVEGAYRDAELRVLDARGGTVSSVPVRLRPIGDFDSSAGRDDTAYAVHCLVPMTSAAHSVSLIERETTLFARRLVMTAPQLSALTAERHGHSIELTWHTTHADAEVAHTVLVNERSRQWLPAAVLPAGAPGPRSTTIYTVDETAVRVAVLATAWPATTLGLVTVPGAGPTPAG